MTNIFYTSDLHIGHLFCAEHRGFDNYEDHDAVLAERWDSVVAPNDTVIIVGDISAGGNRAQHRALTWLDNRPGSKEVILGNHDGPHPLHSDADKWDTHYRKHFTHVRTYRRKKILGHNVLVSHFPYLGAGDRGPEERYPQWRLPDMGLPLIHGHTHSEEKISHTDKGTLMIQVGVDAWDLTPVPLRDLEELVRDAA